MNSLCLKLASKLGGKLSCPIRKFFVKPSVVACEVEDRPDCYHLTVLGILLEQLGFVFTEDDWMSVCTRLTEEAWAKADGIVKEEGACKAEIVEKSDKADAIKHEHVESKSESQDAGAAGAGVPALFGGVKVDASAEPRDLDDFGSKLIRRLNQTVTAQKELIKQLRSKVTSLRNQGCRMRCKWNAVKAQHRRGKKREKPDQFHTGVGKSKGRVGDYAGVKISLMRSVAATAAYKVGTSQYTDVSGQTVARWNHKTAATLDVASQDWHAEHLAALQNPAANKKGRQWAIFSPRSDATNRKLVHKEQLQVLVCGSRFSLIDPSAPRDNNRVEDRQEHWADTLPVKGHTASATKGLILKQLKSIGVPTWEDQDELYKKLGKFKEDGTFDGWKEGKPTWRTIYCTTTDEGSDERKVRDDMGYVLASLCFCLFFELMCLLHRYHLICKALLAAADQFLTILEISEELPSQSFVSCCSITSNTLREFSAPLRDAWLKKYPGTPKREASQLPPRCLIGRWGAAAAFLRWWLVRSFEELREVVLFVFVVARAEQEAKAKAQSKNTPKDEEGDDAKENYQVRVGRWRAATLKTTSSEGLRFVVRAVLEVQKVMDHVQFFLMSRQFEHGVFLELVWTGNVRLKEHFHKLGEEGTWADVFANRPSTCNEAKSIGLCLWHSAQAYCDYQFRIADQIQSYPLRWFLIVRADPEIECNVRKAIAREVRTLDPTVLGDSIAKIRVDLAEELDVAEKEER